MRLYNKLLPLLFTIGLIFGCSTPPKPVFSPLPPPLPPSPSHAEMLGNMRRAIAGLPPTNRVAKASAITTPSTNIVKMAMLSQSNPPPTVTLGWDGSASEGTITNLSYRVYQGPASRNYTNTFDAGTNHVITISNFPRGSLLFYAATAYDPATKLESDYSNEVSWQSMAPPLPPGMLQIQTFTANTLEGPWVVYEPWPMQSFTNSVGNAFFKLVITGGSE